MVGGSPRRRPGWFALVPVALLVVPILEVWVILQVGRVIGGWQTLLLLVFWSALGAWLVKREGVRTWRALQGALRSGTGLSRELSDAALVLVGGTLLLAPGFLTDALGLALMLPFTRPLARRLLQRVVERRLLAPAAEGLVTRVTTVPGASAPRREGPPAPRRDGEVVEGVILDDRRP